MITTWTQGSADYNMDEEILTLLRDLTLQHPWWQARAKLAVDLLKQNGILPPARVLDAGCGWGSNLFALEQAGYQTVGLDISRSCLEALDQPGRELIECDLTQPLPDNIVPFDAVISLDVIEHLDDDAEAVTRLAQLCRPGGLILVSVPALPELFSEFDRIQGHRRRYIPETLRLAFAQSNLDLKQVLWWGSWMVPILARRRQRDRGTAGQTPAQIYTKYLSLPPWPLSTGLRMAFALEHKRALRGQLGTGTSLLAVARH